MDLKIKKSSGMLLCPSSWHKGAPLLPAGRFKWLLGGSTNVGEELVSGLHASTLAGSPWVAQGAAVGRRWLEKDAVGKTGQQACGRAVVRAGSQ